MLDKNSPANKLLIMRNPGALIASSIMAIVLSTVVFLLDNPIKYFLYVFGLSLTGLLYLKLFRDGYKIKLVLPTSIKFGDYSLIACSIIVLAYNVISLSYNVVPSIGNISFIPSLIVSFFLPGWALLRLLGADYGPRSSVGLFVLSFLISIGLSALIYMAVVPFKTGSSAVFLSVIYVFISFSPLLKDRYKSVINRRSPSFYKYREYDLFDILLIAWVVVFFIFVISILYPALSFLPGSDIVRHFSQTEELIKIPSLYNSDDYPWFHFVLADVIKLSSPPMWLFQSVIAFLSITLFFSFYGMAKTYLSGVDRRAPIIATILFSVFSGFGWFYFIQQEVLQGANQSNPLHLLYASNEASYWDIGFGQSPWLWFWFRPLTVGFTIFFALLYLMRLEGLSRQNYIIISSLLVLVLSQVHIPELIVFVAFLFVIALFFPALRLRLKETSIAVIIGVIFSPLVSFAIPRLLHSQYFSSHQEIFLLLLLLAGSSFLLAKYCRRPKTSLRANLTIITSIALFVYLSVLFHWFLGPGSLVLNTVFNILAVPWQYYPLLLGIVGIFAVPGIGFASRRYRNHPIMIFVTLFIFSIVFGRLLTYINSNLEYTEYWERRMIPFVFVSCSMLAPITLLWLADSLKRKQQIAKRFGSVHNLLTVVVLSFIVLGGIFSTLISVEYQIINAQKNTLSRDEFDILSSLRNIDPYSTVLTATDRSANVAEFVNPGYIIGYYKYQLWPERSPELPLRVLSVLNSTSIIWRSGDQQLVNSAYGNGYIASHLLKILPAIKKSSSGVFQAPRLSPPSSVSDVVLVLPESGNNETYPYYAYDLLSTAGYNYTTAPISDIASISKAKVLVSTSEDIAYQLMQYKKEYDLQYDKLIILNTNGYGPLVFTQVGRVPASFSIAGNNNASTDWKPIGLSTGRVGIPKVTSNTSNNAHTMIPSENSIKITVGKGRYSLWQISKQYAKPLNGSKFDFANFNWYGKGNGKWYVLEFHTHSTAPGQSFWYRFQDTWRGWKQVILPLGILNGRGYDNGVTFDKVAEQGASWSKITSIDFRPEASNLNEAGEFYLNGFDFGSWHSSAIKWISSNKETQLPAGIPIYPIVPVWKNYNVTSYYVYKKDNTTIPFTLFKRYPGYDIIYLNVEPIIQRMNAGSDASRPFYPILTKLLEFDGIKLPKYKFLDTNIRRLVTGGVTAFGNVTFSKNLTMTSPSAIISIQNPSIMINVDGRNLRLSNVSSIAPINVQNITIRSKTGGVIDGGYGFYTRAALNQSLVNFVGHPAVLSIISGTQGQKTTTNNIITGNKIQISLGKSISLLRQPRISSSGIASFSNFYAYGELYSTLRSVGQDLRVTGKVTFISDYSGQFTVAHNTSLDGTIVHSPPLYKYDELGNLYDIFGLPNMRHLIALAIVFISLGIYGFRSEKTKQKL
jgi:hypothetical protein